MLVYGDRSETVDPRRRLETIAKAAERLRVMPPGIDRHSALVSVLIDTGQLLQGLADLGSAEADQVNTYLYDLARCVIRSCDSGHSEMGALPSVPLLLELPSLVELRVPEGFAFYALYPEAYVEAARRLALTRPPFVIGIRSIGTTLGAMVAAALNAGPPVTVRPHGDPYARQVQLPEALPTDRHFVIVDEGPGMSGSSFGSVADALEARRVPRERIAFVPSHSGDLGPEASEAHRRRWQAAQRPAAEFDSRWLGARFESLREFDTAGISARRKYVAEKGGQTLLVKFAGLGRLGAQKLEMARKFATAGLSPEPVGLMHGFLVERWHGEARPLGESEKPLAEIGHYIGTRARLFPAEDNSGASLEQLLEMARRNVAIALGSAASDRIPDVPQVSMKRVRTDNKLDRREWLRLPDGRLLKSDALDHHQAHDLTGCQDAAWDVAGAICEFGLNEREADAVVAATGCHIDRQLLDFYRVPYAAFRLGQAVLGEQPAERYAAELERLLLHGHGGIPPKSALG